MHTLTHSRPAHSGGESVESQHLMSVYPYGNSIYGCYTSVPISHLCYGSC